MKLIPVFSSLVSLAGVFSIYSNCSSPFFKQQSNLFIEYLGVCSPNDTDQWHDCQADRCSEHGCVAFYHNRLERKCCYVNFSVYITYTSKQPGLSVIKVNIDYYERVCRVHACDFQFRGLSSLQFNYALIDNAEYLNFFGVNISKSSCQSLCNVVPGCILIAFRETRLGQCLLYRSSDDSLDRPPGDWSFEQRLGCREPPAHGLCTQFYLVPGFAFMGAGLSNVNVSDGQLDEAGCIQRCTYDNGCSFGVTFIYSNESRDEKGTCVLMQMDKAENMPGTLAFPGALSYVRLKANRCLEWSDNLPKAFKSREIKEVRALKDLIGDKDSKTVSPPVVEHISNSTLYRLIWTCLYITVAWTEKVSVKPTPGIALVAAQEEFCASLNCHKDAECRTIGDRTMYCACKTGFYGNGTLCVSGKALKGQSIWGSKKQKTLIGIVGVIIFLVIVLGCHMVLVTKQCFPRGRNARPSLPYNRASLPASLPVRSDPVRTSRGHHQFKTRDMRQSRRDTLGRGHYEDRTSLH